MPRDFPVVQCDLLAKALWVRWQSAGKASVFDEEICESSADIRIPRLPSVLFQLTARRFCRSERLSQRATLDMFTELGHSISFSPNSKFTGASQLDICFVRITERAFGRCAVTTTWRHLSDSCYVDHASPGSPSLAVRRWFAFAGCECSELVGAVTRMPHQRRHWEDSRQKIRGWGCG